MSARSKHVCRAASLFTLTLWAACQQRDPGELGLALCEQTFRVDGEQRYGVGAECARFDDAYATSFVSDLTPSPDLKVVGVASRGGFRVTATSRGTTVATGALSPPQLHAGEKLILGVKTVEGDTYEFRYWGSRKIDPGEYLDGIDAGWVDGGFR